MTTARSGTWDTATTLVAGGTNGVTDVFLHDRGEGSTTTPG